MKALTANILDKPIFPLMIFPSELTYLPARHDYATLIQNDFQDT